MFDPFGTAATAPYRKGTTKRHALHPGWPESSPVVQLPESHPFPQGVRLRLRPLRRQDGVHWRRMRLHDEPYLRPVEPTLPHGWQEGHSRQGWWDHLVNLRSAALNGTVVPFAIEVDGQFAGQLTLGNIQHGVIRECWIGYWVFSGFTGGGVATVACGLGVDHAFRRVGLHRVTATYLPENPASGKVLTANGFRVEGFLRRNLHIDGAWRDHHFLALNRDDYSSTCLDRLCAQGKVAGIVRLPQR